MGQAKQRGSFNQRKAEGEARLKLEEQLRREKEAAMEASLTPEQKAKRLKFSTLLAGILALTSLSNRRNRG